MQEHHLVHARDAAHGELVEVGAPRCGRLVARLLGSYRRFAPSRLDPLLIRDRAAARGSLERILAWDFDRVIVAHGEVLEHGGREALRAGYRWLLDG